MAGYYCLGGAAVPNPRDDPTGARCPRGNWCAAGQQPVACPLGTYNDKVGAASASYCLACPAGLTCTAVGLPAPVSDCAAGKYCVGTTATDCTAGHYCPAGEAAELLCPPGTYQAATGQALCPACPAGSYCGGASWGGAAAATTCPQGFFCPTGTSEPEQHPCPAGRYGAATGLASADACTGCPASQHCNRPGLLAPSGTCLDGYYCGPGSAGATGTGPCPTDFYCASGQKTECPAGTQSGGPGAAAADECVPCPPGYVCADHERGMVACPAGRYCSGGAASTADTDPAVRSCPSGSYCPAGSALPLLCPPGTFGDVAGLSVCRPCPVGAYCPDSGMSSASTCPANMACPVAGSYTPAVCPPGTYAAANATCLACPAGKFCWPVAGGDGRSTESCDALYVCQSGSSSKYPYPSDMNAIQPVGSAFAAYNGPAYPGYVSDGVRNVACGPGTYRPGVYGSSCVVCPEGRYCPRAAMSSADAYLCAGGHLCNGGATVPAPTLASTQGGISCPSGFFCPAGAYHPMRCPDGYESPGEGAALCSACPEGRYCAAATTSWSAGTTATDAATSRACPSGATCGGGVPALPVCDSGWLSAGTACSPCPWGSYCRGGKVAGTCVAGYQCGWGQSEPDPWDSLCAAGSYCPHGATAAPLCAPGTMSTATGARQATDCTSCQPGWLCPLRRGAAATPCPPGHYCPLDTEVAVPCPQGTWSAEELLVTAQECAPCKAGFSCPATGIAALTGLECPTGHFCPLATWATIPCPAGTYRNDTGGEEELDCARCPSGFYCPVATSTPLSCEDGTYCKVGAAAPRTVPGGSYSNAGTGFQRTACPFNHRCPRGAKAPERCTGRTVCPPGSESGSLCPAGSYVHDNSAYQTVDACLPCPAGSQSTLGDA
mgnify:CR=1 FL=1